MGLKGLAGLAGSYYLPSTFSNLRSKCNYEYQVRYRRRGTGTFILFANSVFRDFAAAMRFVHEFVNTIKITGILG